MAETVSSGSVKFHPQIGERYLKMDIKFQDHRSDGDKEEVFSRVKNHNPLDRRYRLEVRIEAFKQKVNKILFVVSVAIIVALATQATAAKVFVF